MDDRDFDFWIGRWRVRWGDDAEGTNVVSKIFDGKAWETLWEIRYERLRDDIVPR